ncbi:hypothetical protein OS493_039323, partial [Desmophyllum pertusum]
MTYRGSLRILPHREMPHCVAFGCSNQTINRKNLEATAFPYFPTNVIDLRRCMDSSCWK